MAKKIRFKKRIKVKIKKPCFFCQKSQSPDYKNIEELEKFVSDRAKILGRDNTGLCQKHQKRLKVAVKRARHLSLLPFVARV